VTAIDPLSEYAEIRIRPEHRMANVTPASPGDVDELREMFEDVDSARIRRRLAELSVVRCAVCGTDFRGERCTSCDIPRHE
jgi:hypothetical protein